MVMAVTFSMDVRPTLGTALTCAIGKSIIPTAAEAKSALVSIEARTARVASKSAALDQRSIDVRRVHFGVGLKHDDLIIFDAVEMLGSANGVHHHKRDFKHNFINPSTVLCNVTCAKI